MAERHPHPVKAKREEGATKTRLVPDPVRGPVMTQIFVWRELEQLSYAHIAQRLNTDPQRYPSPEPVRWEGHDRAVGAWTPSSMRDVLDDPQYTGYMVWNRRRGHAGRAQTGHRWRILLAVSGENNN